MFLKHLLPCWIFFFLAILPHCTVGTPLIVADSIKIFSRGRKALTELLIFSLWIAEKKKEGHSLT